MNAAQIASDTRGVSLIEFAITLPFLVLLFVGGYQLSDGIAAKRKVTTTTRTIADLTTQNATVTIGDLDTILSASTQVLAPYKISAGNFVISQIKVDGSGNATVDWSRGLNATGLLPGTPFNLPSAIKTNNSWIVVAQVNYTYTPVIASNLIGVVPMQDTIFMNPRKSASVALSS